MYTASIYFSVLTWLQHHMLTCLFRKFFHIDCPGCGFQRSVLELLRGDFSGSFRLYPATLPILFLLGFTALHLVMNFRNGALFIKYGYLLTGALILVSYILKLISQHLL